MSGTPSPAVVSVAQAGILGVRTTRRELDEEYRRERGALRRRLDPRLSSRDLLALARAHTKRAYTDALLQLIAIHDSASPRVLRQLFNMARSRPGVLNAIATSGRASRRLLMDLRRSTWTSVREHAAIALGQVQGARG